MALAAAATLPAGAEAACKKDAVIESRSVTTHLPGACTGAGAGDAYALFVASGDFDPAAQEGRKLADVGAALELLPASSRALFVDARQGPSEWWGVGDVPPSGDVDVLLWPAASPCALTTDVGARTGAALGVLANGRMLVVGGEPPPGSAVPSTFVADLATGDVLPLALGLLVPRTRASVTAFGDGGVVAGGARGDGALLDSAEVFAAARSGRGAGDFDRAAITLSTPRADHGAVVLATGETLLVGGTAGNGPLGSLEVVDPVTRSPRTESLASLHVARTKPKVLRLASGEILVAGGFDRDGAPVKTLEWLTPDARPSTRRTTDLVAKQRSAFVALPGGGALAVLAPDPGDLPFQNVWVISADGSTDAGAPVRVPMVGEVALFGSAEGKPVLWAGDRWLVWQPWSGSFAALAAADGAPGPSDDAVAAPDPGLATWLEHGAATRLVGLRFDTRGAFASIQGSLLAGDPSFTAPDRLVFPGVTSAIAFDAESGLTLAAGASVFVTDATYAAVTVDIDAPTGEPPHVVLRDERGAELEIGGLGCPVTAGASTLHVTRSGAKVTVNGAPCAASVREAARVAVGLRGGAPRSVARNLRLARHA